MEALSTYHVETTLSNIDAGVTRLLVLGALALICNFVYFGTAAYLGFKHKLYTMPLIGTLVFIPHDLHYVLLYDKWFNVYDQWFMQLFFAGLIITNVLEMIFFYQVLRWGRKEILPQVSQRAYVAIIFAALAGVASCGVDAESLIAGKECNAAGECAEGYECDPSNGLCVPIGQVGEGGSSGTCSSEEDCDTPSEPCQTAVCVNGVCGVAQVPPDSVAPQQEPGNCQLEICDEDGMVSSINDDEDVPDDGLECTVDGCNFSNGQCQFQPLDGPLPAWDGPGNCLHVVCNAGMIDGIPDDIDVKCESPTAIAISGADRQRVGQIAAEIRAFRKPEPYKGKGIRYDDERIVRKEGKKK